MQRYFIKNNQILSNQVIIRDQDFHHIKNVMRMKVSDVVTIVDESQHVYYARINAFYANSVELEIVSEDKHNVEIPANITIAIGLTKKDKIEEVTKRITELGAIGLITVEMRRSILKLKDIKSFKLERYQTIVKEASEQSHRSRLMNVYDPLTFKDFLSFSKKFDICLYAYEESGKNDVHNFDRYINQMKNKNVLILTGPEGGFDESEIAQLNAHKFNAIGLGPRILRCETAPLYIMSAISYELEIKDEN